MPQPAKTPKPDGFLATSRREANAPFRMSAALKAASLRARQDAEPTATTAPAAASDPPSHVPRPRAAGAELRARLTGTQNIDAAGPQEWGQEHAQQLAAQIVDENAIPAAETPLGQPEKQSTRGDSKPLRAGQDIGKDPAPRAERRNHGGTPEAMGRAPQTAPVGMPATAPAPDAPNTPRPGGPKHGEPGKGGPGKPGPGKPGPGKRGPGQGGSGQGGPGRGGAGNNMPGRPANHPTRPGQPGPRIIESRPPAEAARLRPRHYGVIASFLALVIIPIALWGAYLLYFSEDQFSSRVAFSVRKEEAASPAEFMGGVAQFIGASSNGGDTDILYEFIQSQDMVARIDARLSLREHFEAPYRGDPVFSLSPEGTIEDLRDYWERMARISYDASTGLIDVTVLAFSPEMARQIAQEIVAEGQALVNDLNAAARADTLRYAEADVATALARLKGAREAMVEFRTRTRIVDPQSDLEGRLGVLSGLQQQLAEALVEYDLLAESTRTNDARLVQNGRRIEAIRARITDERRAFAEDDAMGEAYPKLLAQYEGLVVDRAYAEETYHVALAALDIARSTAARQTRYLATYIRPTLAEQAEYPRRIVLFSLAALFLFLSWGTLTLLFYALRDRK